MGKGVRSVDSTGEGPRVPKELRQNGTGAGASSVGPPKLTGSSTKGKSADVRGHRTSDSRERKGVCRDDSNKLGNNGESQVVGPRRKMKKTLTDPPSLLRRAFKEDSPDFQQTVRFRRLQEARGERKTHLAETTGLEKDPAKRVSTGVRNGQTTSAPGTRGDEPLEGIGRSSDRGRQVEHSGGEEGNFSETSQRPGNQEVLETAADVGDETSDQELRDELAAERRRRGKRQKNVEKNPTEKSQGPVSANETSKGFATALETILSRELTKSSSPSSGKAPILSEAPEVYEELSNKKLTEKANKQKRAERRALMDRCHRTVDALDADYERSLKKIATTGVVKLFNAIIQVRKKKARSGLDADDEEGLEGRDLRRKKRREYQRLRQRKKSSKAKRSHVGGWKQEHSPKRFKDGERKRLKGKK